MMISIQNLRPLGSFSMKMKLLTVALLSALGVAGCGSDNDDPITTVRSAAPSFSAA